MRTCYPFDEPCRGFKPFKRSKQSIEKSSDFNKPTGAISPADFREQEYPTADEIAMEIRILQNG